MRKALILVIALALALGATSALGVGTAAANDRGHGHEHGHGHDRDQGPSSNGNHDDINVTSEVLPGVVRHFDSYQDAALEAGQSRIFAGVHTRLDHEAGLRLGQDVADYVLARNDEG